MTAAVQSAAVHPAVSRTARETVYFWTVVCELFWEKGGTGSLTTL